MQHLLQHLRRSLAIVQRSKPGEARDFLVQTLNVAILELERLQPMRLLERMEDLMRTVQQLITAVIGAINSKNAQIAELNTKLAEAQSQAVPAELVAQLEALVPEEPAPAPAPQG